MTIAKPKVLIIRTPGDKLSNEYAEITRQSWETHGHQTEIFDGTTPDDLKKPTHKKRVKLNIQKKSNQATRDGRIFTFSETEEAVFYSHLDAWEYVISKNESMIIVEHDGKIQEYKEIDFSEYDYYQLAPNPLGASYYTPEFLQKLFDVMMPEKILNADVNIDGILSEFCIISNMNVKTKNVKYLVDTSWAKSTIDHRKLYRASKTVDNIWMIQIPDNDKSQHYKNLVLPSWAYYGHEVNMFDAVTPEKLDNYNYLEFGKFWGFRDFTETEKAGFYSHVELWLKCITENKPITIIEHDVMCYSQNIPIISSLFAFANFTSDDEWEKYSGHRFRKHPYWGERKKLCPTTHAYYVTPDRADELFNQITGRPQHNFVDDIIFESMGQSEKLIRSDCKPVFDMEIGGTMEH